MTTMGAIRYSEYGGCHVFRFEGDVRTVALGGLDLAQKFEHFAATLIKESRGNELVFDLTAAEAIDSTHLGLIAHTAAEWPDRPVLFSTRPGITKTLLTMRMDILVKIVESEPAHAEALGALPEPLSGRSHDEVVYNAHKALAALSEDNKARFQSILEVMQPKDAES